MGKSRLSPQAEQDIESILCWTQHYFGKRGPPAV
jgi:plasmid stabilization system protein ParE